MASFRDLLKEVENANKTGFKSNAWFPHKSVEGGTRTLAYGHKLSKQEEDGNYVVLPNGKIIDFDVRGLTEDEAETLLDADIQKHKSIAATQWNNFQKTPFSTLSPMHQSVLTEIVYNIGSLKNSKGKWGWPSLAKGILNNDDEVVKKEIMRSFTNPQGKRVELTSRVNKIRGFIDQYNQDPASVSLEGFDSGQSPEEPEQAYSALVDSLMQQLNTMAQPQQRPRETASEPTMRDSEAERVDSYLDRVFSEQETTIRRGERRLEETYNEVVAEETGGEFSKEEEKQIDKVMQLFSEQPRVQLRETTNPAPTETTEEPEERVNDTTKDPIYGLF